jgi:Peptidase family M23
MKFRLTSPYGALEEFREGVPHKGIDLGFPAGTPVESAMNGVIEKVLDLGNTNIGKGVFVKFEDGTTGIYGHLSRINVRPGDVVEKGDVLGLSGSTGFSSGPHLHFALKDAGGHFTDPTPLASGVWDIIRERGKVNGFKGAPEHSLLLEKWNELSNFVIGKETELLWNPFIAFLQESFISLGSWFVVNLPDIMGYGTVLAGAAIVLGPFFGKTGIIKPFLFYAGFFILAVCILGGV